MVHLFQQHQQQGFTAGDGSSWQVKEDNGSTILVGTVLAKMILIVTNWTMNGQISTIFLSSEELQHR